MRLPYSLGYLLLVALPLASHAQQPLEQRSKVESRVKTILNFRLMR